jgi:GNAT superfamily N-acetyltransferase
VPSSSVRPFRRSDRDQLTTLVSAHVEAVLPGVTVSPNAVLAQLEREPGEYVVDPWVRSRETLVAELDGRVVAAAHLLHYDDGAHVGPGFRGAGEVRWLLHWPGQHPSQAVTMSAAGDALAAAALDRLADARGPLLAGGALPAPGVYGVPDRWPHVAATLERAGFAPGPDIELVLLADVAALPRGCRAPDGWTCRTRLGGHAVRHEAVRDGRVDGFVEIAADLTHGGTLSRLAGWADVWELHVEPEYRRRGIGRWLLGVAADRLRLARAERVLACGTPESEEHAFLAAHGFVELTRTARWWRRA